MSFTIPESTRDAIEIQQRAALAALKHGRFHDLAVEFLDSFAQATPGTPYHRLPPWCQKTLDELKRAGHPALTHSFLRYVLATGMMAAPSRIGGARLPRSVEELYPRHLARMASEFSGNTDDFYSVSCDRFLKDLCLVTLRLYPAGARLIQPDCGIPRRLIWQGNPASSTVALARLTFLGRGFRPYLQSHLHTSDLVDFNPEGMQQTYIRIADLLRADERLLGYYTASWFNDPVVADVSPRLAYLQEIPIIGGAFPLKGTSDENTTAAAISRSPTRRHLYTTGKYSPRTYYFVWPRRALLAWVDSLFAQKPRGTH